MFMHFMPGPATVTSKIKKKSEMKVAKDKCGIFHLFGLIATSFIYRVTDYEDEVYNFELCGNGSKFPGVKYPYDESNVLNKIISFELKPWVFDLSKLLVILKNAESGKPEKVALAKSILIKMEQHECEWDWRSAWVNEPKIGFDYDPIRPASSELLRQAKDSNDLKKIVRIIHDGLEQYSIKAIFEEFDI